MTQEIRIKIKSTGKNAYIEVYKDDTVKVLKEEFYDKFKREKDDDLIWTLNGKVLSEDLQIRLLDIKDRDVVELIYDESRTESSRSLFQQFQKSSTSNVKDKDCTCEEIIIH